MAIVLVQVTLINKSSFPIKWLDDGRPHGFWQAPWYPSNLKALKPGEQGTWRLESGGIMTGVEGWAYFQVDVPFASNVGVRSEYLTLWWERPYIGTFDGTIDQKTTEGQAHRVIANTTGIYNMGGGDGFFEVALMGAWPELTVPASLAHGATASRVWWVVEVVDASADFSTLPLVVSPKHRYADAVLVDAAPHQVWGALTRSPSAHEVWLQQAVESDWRPGAPIYFRDVRTREIAVEGRILHADDSRRLSFTLQAARMPDGVLRPEHDRDRPPLPDPCITITLEREGEQTKVALVVDDENHRATHDLHEALREILSALKKVVAEKRDIQGL